MGRNFEGHSEQQIAAIARQVGGRVDTIRVHGTSAGSRVIAKITVPSSLASFAMLQLLAKEDAGDPIVRDFAFGIRAEVGGDPETFARALQQWVQDNIAFVAEQTETFEDAAYTLSVRAGDCDAHSRLVFAAFESVAIPARIVPLMRGKDEVAHAVTQVQVNGGWRWVETTVKAEFGEHPIAAARRLGLAARKDIVAGEG